jgi:hypothetical protein
LQGIEVMITSVEEKLFSDVINDDTYKRICRNSKENRVN